MQLGENLFTLRKKNGFSQEELAEKCKVSRQAIAKWENDESVPTIEKLIFLADLYDISLDDLVGRNTIDKFTQLQKLLREFIAKDFPANENDDISGMVTRYLLYTERVGLDATARLNGLLEIFCEVSV